jgi:hypothetical protein
MNRKPKRTLERPTAAQRAARTARGAAKFDESDARLVVNLPEAVHQAIKMRAVERRLTMREYVIGLLRADGIDV